MDAADFNDTHLVNGLDPQPSTLIPTSTSSTLNPQSYTPHPTPHTLHPQFSTLNDTHLVNGLNPQLSTLNPQP